MVYNSCYLLVGENEFEKEEFIKSIKDAVINEKFIDTDFIILYGDRSISNIIPWLYSYPFGSNKKLAIIKRVEKLSSEDKELIQKYINKPAHTSILILIKNEEKDPKIKEKNTDFYNITTIEFKNLSYQSMRNWVISYVKNKEFDIEDGAIELLYEILGTDQFALATELDKIINYIEGDKIITEEKIKNLFTKEITTPKYIIYSLAHSIAYKNLDTAYKKLNLILQFDNSQKNISNVLWKIIEHFNELLKIKTNTDYSPKYYKNEYKKESKLWTKEKILNAFCLLFEADFSIKTGRVDKEFIIEELIYKLCYC